MQEELLPKTLNQLREAAEGYQPPCMGWSTWNRFRQNINEALIMETACAMKSSGLLSAGYRYINLDDCWQASIRSREYRLQFDKGRFPGGEGLITQLNKEGFRVGLYSSAGTMTCEDMPGSCGFEDIDAETFARWGVSYLKYDYCHVVDLETDPHYAKDSFPSRTPPVEYIAIPLTPGAAETVFPAAGARVEGAAFFDGNAIQGLCGGKGAAVFNVEAPEDGRYALYLGYLKSLNPHRQYVQAMVNDSKCFDGWFPPSSGWSDTGRIMMEIELNEGKNTIKLHNPIRGQKEDSVLRYIRMGAALKKAYGNREYAYSICEHGRTEPWLWASGFASSWRIAGDIRNNWESVLMCYEKAVSLWNYQQPGAYNDPDMLEVGNGENLTQTQNAAHFALWCMLAAPLILGCDVRDMDSKLLGVVTNRRLIQINQDPLLLQAKRVYNADDIDVLVKPLWDGSHAVCVFNRSNENKERLTFSIAELLSLDGRLAVNGDIFRIKDIFTDCEAEGKNFFVNRILPHGAFIIQAFGNTHI